MRDRTLTPPYFASPGSVLPALLPALLLAFAAGPAGARQEAPEQAKAEVTEAVSKTRKMLLHLNSGLVYRGKAREKTGGSWEIQQRGDWVSIPGAMVIRAKLEKDVLAQSRKLERQSRKDHLRRAAYGDWLLQEGLYVEGLQAIDAILRKEPDHEQACAVLERRDPPVGLPRSEQLDASHLDALLSVCAQGSPAIQEIAAQRLKMADEIDGLEKRLLAELHSKTTNRRTFATLGLRRVFPGRHVRPLLSRAVLDVSGDVRTGAALALREVGDPAVAVPAIRALGSKQGTVRKNAAVALGTMNYKAAVAPLMSHLTSLKKQSATNNGAPRSHIYIGRQFAYVQDFDVEVAQSSAIADPVINVLTEGIVLEAAAIGIHETSIATERSAVRRSLAGLTGAEPGNTTASWERWWKEHGDEWKAVLSPPGPPSTPVGRGN